MVRRCDTDLSARLQLGATGRLRPVAARSAATALAASRRYLPPDLRMYGSALDQHGSWQNEASYGNVWYPNVAAVWQPTTMATGRRCLDKLDLDRATVGLADASLRALGVSAEPVVLDSRPAMGAGGQAGNGAGICVLVAAWIQQSPGLRTLGVRWRIAMGNGLDRGRP